jgi:5-hydroxyisourate hydrolase
MSVWLNVVDGVYGRPAVNMGVRLVRETGGVFAEQWRDRTDEEGRVARLQTGALTRGTYALELDLEDYFCTLGFKPLNAAVTMRFRPPGDERGYRLFVLVTPSSCITFTEG